MRTASGPRDPGLDWSGVESRGRRCGNVCLHDPFSLFQYCTVHRLSTEFGWKAKEVLDTLETKRKVKSKEFYEAKKKDAVRFTLGKRVREIKCER